MNSLRLKNFKAYRDEFDKLFKNGYLPIDKKNFLLYGENGLGKSSIYEAIKIIFFREKLQQSIIRATTPEEQKQYNSDFWSKYNNKQVIDSFEVEINGNSYQDFDNSNYQLFMISIDKFCISEPIQLDILLEKFDLNIKDIRTLCQNHFENIQDEVNKKLKDFIEDNISIEIDNEMDFKIKIKDSIRNLESINEITKYFNEAKLNLIILLLIFESIKCAKNRDKKKILVLDDFITSLDIANRTFLIRYIFDNFSEFQILIFTYNVYFYNLIIYLIKHYKIDNNWKFANLYEINGEHKIYIKNTIEKVKDIREDYKTNSDIDVIGNKIRQKFEILLYEFSKLIMINSIEDSKEIIKRIENSKNIYFYNKKTASDLVDELEEIISSDNHHNLQNRLKQKINLYKKDFQKIKDIVNTLKIYQKVTLHTMSHGTIGQNSFTTKEIRETFNLLEKFEKSIITLINDNIDGA